MKLSFSTNRWSGFALDEFIDIAKEYTEHIVQLIPT